MPPDWPSPKDKAWAVHYWNADGRLYLASRVAAEAEKCRYHHQVKETLAANWVVLWRVWVIKAVHGNQPREYAIDHRPGG